MDVKKWLGEKVFKNNAAAATAHNANARASNIINFEEGQGKFRCSTCGTMYGSLGGMFAGADEAYIEVTCYQGHYNKLISDGKTPQPLPAGDTPPESGDDTPGLQAPIVGTSPGGDGPSLKPETPPAEPWVPHCDLTNNANNGLHDRRCHIPTVPLAQVVRIPRGG